MLAEIHEGVCGNHPSSRTLAHRAHTQGYYWPTMRADIVAYVKKSDRCKREAPMSRMSCDSSKSEGPLINHQLMENLWISRNPIPHHVSHLPRSTILIKIGQSLLCMWSFIQNPTCTIYHNMTYPRSNIIE